MSVIRCEFIDSSFMSGRGLGPSLAGIQAAVAAGLGLSILSEIAIQADHRVLTAKDGFAPIDKTEVALVASPDASP